MKKGQKWVSEIAYLPVKQGRLYLTIIMDLYDRKIIGWALSSTMTAQAQLLLPGKWLSEIDHQFNSYYFIPIKGSNMQHMHLQID